MNTNPNRGSAEIIPFPSRARKNSGELRDIAKPATTFAAQRAAKVASGSGWYHEAAFRTPSSRARISILAEDRGACAAQPLKFRNEEKGRPARSAL